jgi:hypothetical protein
MSEILQELIGKSVEVWSTEPDTSAEGVLEAVDRRWLRLRKEEGDVVCVFLFNVFLVRQLPVEKEKRRGIFG